MTEQHDDDDLMTRDEVAHLLGIDPNSVRSTMRRYGIRLLRGYPRSLVLERLKDYPQQGKRTDLDRT